MMRLAPVVLLLGLAPSLLAPSMATPAKAAMEGTAFPHARSDAQVAETICLLIEAAATAHGLPVAFFSRLIGQESSFRPRVEGPVTRNGQRAQGIAQFMPETAAERGLLDPFDPVQALPRSAHFLEELRWRFGNLGLAAAAYNAGPRRVEKYLAGDPFMPAETQHYVAVVTGHTVEQWAAARREGTTLPDPPPESCRSVRAALGASGRTGYAAALEARVATGIAKPWGVQLSAGFSRGKAIAAYSRAERRYGAVLAGRDTMIIASLLRSRGTRSFYQVRAGTDTRREAENLCAALRKAGGACLVLASGRRARPG